MEGIFGSTMYHKSVMTFVLGVKLSESINYYLLWLDGSIEGCNRRSVLVLSAIIFTHIFHESSEV